MFLLRWRRKRFKRRIFLICKDFSLKLTLFQIRVFRDYYQLWAATAFLNARAVQRLTENWTWFSISCYFSFSSFLFWSCAILAQQFLKYSVFLLRWNVSKKLSGKRQFICNAKLCLTDDWNVSFFLYLSAKLTKITVELKIFCSYFLYWN